MKLHDDKYTYLSYLFCEHLPHYNLCDLFETMCIVCLSGGDINYIFVQYFLIQSSDKKHLQCTFFDPRSSQAKENGEVDMSLSLALSCC